MTFLTFTRDYVAKKFLKRSKVSGGNTFLYRG